MSENLINPDFLLRLLNDERQKYTKANRKKMEVWCNELAKAGIYHETPFMKEAGVDFVRMVECYGAWWHTWNPPLVCFSCMANLRDTSLGPPFKRERMNRIHDCDGTSSVTVTCPDCGESVFWM